MSHTTTASLSIRLLSDGSLEVHHDGELSALLDYLADAMKIVAERQAEEVA